MVDIDILISSPGCQDDLAKVVELELGYHVDTEPWLAKVKDMLGEKDYFALVLNTFRGNAPEDDGLVNEVLAIANKKGTPVLITTILPEENLTARFGIQKGVDYQDYLNWPYKTDHLIAKLKEMVEE